MTERRRSQGVVIVTGGSSGLGDAVARAVGDDGGTPVVLDRKPPRGPWRFEEVDLACSAEADAAVQRAAEELGGIDAVVTCAGIDVPGSLLDTPAAEWERVVAVNLLGTAAVIRSSLPHLVRSSGAVLTVASTLGHRAVAHGTAYCASKFGVVGFTRALMAECAELGVCVTLISPGGMDTAFFDGRDERYKPGPQTQLAHPRLVAETVMLALAHRDGCQVKELVVAAPREASWP